MSGREIDPSSVAVPKGYSITAVAQGLTFPTGVTFDDQDRVYVVESGYAYGEVWTTPRLLRIEDNGTIHQIAAGAKNGPWTGVTYADGAFYVAEGGELEGGRILRIAPDGQISTLVENLPTRGDHHTNGPAIGQDGLIYFGLGTATNSAVVGEDNAMFGWLQRNPEFHDIPCKTITLAGRNFETKNALLPESKQPVSTGAFSPFGTSTQKGQTIAGEVPCSGAILRIGAQGGTPELVAWGFRNPFGLAFSPDGQLYVSENGYDVRGSRPVWGAPDVLWKVETGLWYGWPDFSAGKPVASEYFKPPGKDQPEFVLAEHPGKPPQPIALLGVHSSSNGFDFSRNPRFGYEGEAFIAQLGDEAPTTGKVLKPVGFRVVRVNVSNGSIEDFAVNKGSVNGPASKIGGGGLERPVAARFNRDGSTLYVVDFGIMTQDRKGAHPKTGTGVLWKIERENAQ